MIQDLRIEQKMGKILEMLKKRGWYIGIMESCTGGAIANAITNIPGASDVFRCGLVTYCNEAKIKAGVDEKIIEKFGVYSIETAEEMARKIDPLKPGAFGRAGVDVGVGVTGNMNNPAEVFVAVRIGTKTESIKLKVESKNENKVKARVEMKEQVVERVVEMISDNL